MDVAESGCGVVEDLNLIGDRRDMQPNKASHPTPGMIVSRRG